LAAVARKWAANSRTIRVRRRFAWWHRQFALATDRQRNTWFGRRGCLEHGPVRGGGKSEGQSGSPGGIPPPPGSATPPSVPWQPLATSATGSPGTVPRPPGSSILPSTPGQPQSQAATGPPGSPGGQEILVAVYRAEVACNRSLHPPPVKRRQRGKPAWSEARCIGSGKTPNEIANGPIRLAAAPSSTASRPRATRPSSCRHRPSAASWATASGFYSSNAERWILVKHGNQKFSLAELSKKANGEHP